MKAIVPFLVALLLIVLVATTSVKKANENNYYKKLIPPGTAQLTPNFYCDKTEVNNANWREYMQWTAHIFGASSKEYVATLPDTNVWKQKGLATYTTHYFTHPAFNEYPIVGVSQAQAIAFSKWRADRVFESILVKQGKIKWNVTSQNSTNYFTIERYLSGAFMNYVPDPNFNYYPVYTLPTTQQQTAIVHYTDSINTRYEKQNSQTLPTSYTSIKPTLQLANVDAIKAKKNPIHHINTNVAEWLMEPNSCASGNIENVTTTNVTTQTTPNYYTGFRNVCEWKLWVK